jgi:outer membrane protein assembly factor BamD (BamD/ComL family)
MMKRLTLIATISALALSLIIGCSSKPSDESLFEKARAFQESQDYDKAVEVYRDIVRLYPDGERSDEAQFMVGFIYANDLKDFDKAKTEYQAFMDNYSATADSGMVLSAKWEIENLGKDISDIDQLKNITGGASDMVLDEGAVEKAKEAMERIAPEEH